MESRMSVRRPHFITHKNLVVFVSIAVILFLAVYNFLFLTMSKAAPHYDPAEYAYTALSIFNVFADEGFFKGLQSLYFIRGWRPVLAPVLLLPFLSLTGGQAVTAINLACP